MYRIGSVMVALAFSAAGMSCSAPLPPRAAQPETLHLAAAAGDRAAVDAALRAGSAIDRVDGHGRTALSYAAAGDSTVMVAHLLDKGADPNHVSGDGDTPLLIAARKGRFAVAELLVQRGARLDTYGEDGFTALAIATQREDRALFDLLLRLGARPNSSLAKCDTALILSVPLADPSFFDRLLDAGADPNLSGRAGNTPLIVAVYAGRPDRAERLLAKGARVNDANANGYSALHFAVGGTVVDPDLVRLLVERGADVNRTARDGSPPLRLALQSGSADMAVYLYETGARPLFQDVSKEGMELNGTMQHVLGDYFLAQDKVDSAGAAYVAARDHYAKVIEIYRGDISTMMWAEATAGALNDTMMWLQASIASSQAQQQRRQAAQISAMKRAEQTRTGFQGYQAYMAKYNQAYVPTYSMVNMAPLSPPSSQSPLEQKKAYANAKVKQLEERSAVVSAALACFDKNPKGGAGLHACVRAAAKVPAAPDAK